MSISHVLLDRDVVEVSGPDRSEFLQGLISQDVRRVSPARAAYGAFLTSQGKYLHDFCLVEHEGAYWLDCEGGRGQDLASRLARFRLRSRVEIRERDDLRVAAVFGRGAAASLGLKEAEGDCSRVDGIVRFADPRTAALGCRLIGPAGEVEDHLRTLAIPNGNPVAYDRLRISLAVPDGSRDMEVEKSTLLECNLDALNAIDWDKGCYMGQELTARTYYRGLVKRGLFALQSDGDAPPPRTPVDLDGRNLGEIRSVCENLALASLRRDMVGEATDEPILARTGERLRLLAG